MAAGAGYIEFATGDILTASAANQYLASQVVMVFADAAARTSAISSPQEGMISYLKDTNATEYYSGSAWAAVGVAGGGMTLLSTTTLSGSSTLVSSISGSYKNLYIEITNFKPATDDARLYMRPNSVSTANTYYNGEYSLAAGGYAFNDTTWTLTLGSDNTTASNISTFVIPDYANTTTWKVITGTSFNNSATAPTTTVSYRSIIGASNITAAISSLYFHTSTGNFTSGTVKVYGVN